MKIFIFGNGNLSFEDFLEHYVSPIKKVFNNEIEFVLCDFKGVDTLTMELLKCLSAKVSIYHIGEYPRYLPDKYKTKVSQWKLFGGYSTDLERDQAAIETCTHFLAFDFNSNDKRKSGTMKNIEHCKKLSKLNLTEFV